jgi:antirestriction protein ArdC
MAYRGINVVALWVAAKLSGFGSRYWGTYKQWRMLDAQVRKGEHGTPIVFYKEFEREVIGETENDVSTERQLVAKSSFVFNSDQVDGWRSPDLPEKNLIETVETAQFFVGNVGADIRHGGERAYYQPAGDFVQMPDRERFTGTTSTKATESYYATLFHELTHWTGHTARLDRDLSTRFCERAYAMEELVAELGAAFLCADLRVSSTPRPDHAAYISSWLEVLRDDKRALFTAASKAASAADYLDRLQPLSGPSALPKS